MSSNSFCVETLGLSVYSITSSANTDSFTFFPSNVDIFYFFLFSDCYGEDFQFYVE